MPLISSVGPAVADGSCASGAVGPGFGHRGASQTLIARACRPTDGDCRTIRCCGRGPGAWTARVRSAHPARTARTRARLRPVRLGTRQPPDESRPVGAPRVLVCAASPAVAATVRPSTAIATTARAPRPGRRRRRFQLTATWPMPHGAPALESLWTEARGPDADRPKCRRAPQSGR
jgi:hypothetical protein